MGRFDRGGGRLKYAAGQAGGGRVAAKAQEERPRALELATEAQRITADLTRPNARIYWTDLVLTTLAIHDNRLPTEIPLVLELGFNAGDVDCRFIRNGIQG